MKALLIYSRDSGHRKVDKSISFLKKKLSKVFDVLDIVETKNREEAYELERSAGERYDALLVCGGDGTINNAINALMEVEKRPILGFFNFGTMGDFGKSFGIKGGLRKQASIVEKGFVSQFDVGKLITKEETRYFGYFAGVGAFTDVSYKVNRSSKKRFGRISYYWKSMKESLERWNVPYKYKGNREVEQESPFLMCLLGKYIGGLQINALGKVDDGKGEVYLTHHGAFNGLLSTMRKRKRPDDIICKCAFFLDEDMVWCLDGEEGPKGSAQIEIVTKPLRIFCRQK